MSLQFKTGSLNRYETGSALAVSSTGWYDSCHVEDQLEHYKFTETYDLHYGYHKSSDGRNTVIDRYQVPTWKIGEDEFVVAVNQWMSGPPNFQIYAKAVLVNGAETLVIGFNAEELEKFILFNKNSPHQLGLH